MRTAVIMSLRLLMQIASLMKNETDFSANVNAKASATSPSGNIIVAARDGFNEVWVAAFPSIRTRISRLEGSRLSVALTDDVGVAVQGQVEAFGHSSRLLLLLLFTGRLFHGVTGTLAQCLFDDNGRHFSFN